MRLTVCETPNVFFQNDVRAGSRTFYKLIGRIRWRALFFLSGWTTKDETFGVPLLIVIIVILMRHRILFPRLGIKKKDLFFCLYLILILVGSFVCEVQYIKDLIILAWFLFSCGDFWKSANKRMKVLFKRRLYVIWESFVYIKELCLLLLTRRSMLVRIFNYTVSWAVHFFFDSGGIKKLKT